MFRGRRAGVHLIWTAIGSLLCLIALIFIAEIVSITIQRFLISNRFAIALRASLSERPELILACDLGNTPSGDRCREALHMLTNLADMQLFSFNPIAFLLRRVDGINPNPKAFTDPFPDDGNCELQLKNGQSVSCLPIHFYVTDTDPQAVINLKFVVALAGSLASSWFTQDKSFYCSDHDDDSQCFTCAALNADNQVNVEFPLVACRFSITPVLIHGFTNIFYPGGGIQIFVNTLDLLDTQTNTQPN